MVPHLGQLFKARMVETPSGNQVAETTVVAISAETLRLSFTGESGKSYDIRYPVLPNSVRGFSTGPFAPN